MRGLPFMLELCYVCKMSVFERVKINCKVIKVEQADPGLEDGVLEMERAAPQSCTLGVRSGRENLSWMPRHLFSPRGGLTASERLAPPGTSCLDFGKLQRQHQISHLSSCIRAAALVKYSLSHQFPMCKKYKQPVLSHDNCWDRSERDWIIHESISAGSVSGFLHYLVGKACIQSIEKLNNYIINIDSKQ